MVRYEGATFFQKRLQTYIQCFFGPYYIYCRKYLQVLQILSYLKANTYLWKAIGKFLRAVIAEEL